MDSRFLWASDTCSLGNGLMASRTIVIGLSLMSNHLHSQSCVGLLSDHTRYGHSKRVVYLFGGRYGERLVGSIGGSTGGDESCRMEESTINVYNIYLPINRNYAFPCHDGSFWNDMTVIVFWTSRVLHSFAMSSSIDAISDARAAIASGLGNF